MKIVLRGAAAGYEAEHTARIFFPAAELVKTLPGETEDLVLAVAHSRLDLVLVRRGGAVQWRVARPPRSAAAKEREFALCRLLYGLLHPQQRLYIAACRSRWNNHKVSRFQPIYQTGLQRTRSVYDAYFCAVCF